jgi:hypothetical protein
MAALPVTAASNPPPTKNTLPSRPLAWSVRRVFAPAVPAPGLDARFATILDGMCRAVAARAACDRRFAPLALLLWGWLRRTARRFAAVAARPGARPKPRHRPARSAAQRPERPRLPRGFAWLLRCAPETATFGGQLQHLLTDPEMAALLEAAPRLGRHLRPLCQMLGVRPGPAPPPPRPRPPPVAASEGAGAAPPPGAAPPRSPPPLSPRAASGPPIRPGGPPARAAPHPA